MATCSLILQKRGCLLVDNLPFSVNLDRQFVADFERRYSEHFQ